MKSGAGGLGAGARLLAGLVRLYQLVPKPGAPRCRFYPSCSQYALVALERHGAIRGTDLAVRRVLRCHPFNPGGIDHVPPPAGRSHVRAVDRRQGAAA